MAKRKGTTTGSGAANVSSPSAPDTVEQRVVAFAEQLGRLVGTVQAKAEGWLDRQALDEELTRIRDGAADLLSQLGTAAASATSALSASTGATPPQKQTTRKEPGRSAKATAAPPAPAAQGRSGGKVDAPGKKHREAPAPARGVKHSDETISKGKAWQSMRRTQRRG